MNRLRKITNNRNFRSPKIDREFMRGALSSKTLKILGVVVVIIIALVLISNLGNNNSSVKSSNDITEIGEPIAREELNREFKFPIKDSSNEQLGEINYEITNIEIRDEIIIQGKKYASVKGRTFAILSIKITNEFDQSIEVNSRNYVRLATDPQEGEQEWLAPDTHNDPVAVQAISTKPTRVAFTIDDNVEKLLLQVGEIKGEKEVIELSIKP